MTSSWKKFSLLVLCICIFALLEGLLGVPAAFAAELPYSISDTWPYTIVHHVEIQNPTNRTVWGVELRVPLMDQESTSYQTLTAEQFSPWPDEIVTDANGHREAVYFFSSLAAGETIILEQKYGVESNAVHYDINSSLVSSEQDLSLLETSRYLEPEPGIESDSEEIRAYAQQIAGTETNPYVLARRAFSDINQYLQYDVEGTGEQGALAALYGAVGNCDDYAKLFVAVMRALGVPARVQSGYLYQPQEHNTEPYLDVEVGRVYLNSLRHAWAEFYLEEFGWVPVDPTYTYTVEINGETRKFVNWNYFASVPSTRRYLAFCQGAESEAQIYYQTQSGSLEVRFDAYLLYGEALLPYHDIDGHWAQDAVLYLHNRDLVNGIGEGFFGVSQGLTRAELATLLTRVFSSETEQQDSVAADGQTNAAESTTFPDVPQSHWAWEAIENAAARGWVSGYPDGSYRPNAVLTRAEAAKVIVLAFELEMGSLPVEFKDLGQSGYAWADASIRVLASNGISQGTGNGYFEPQKGLTRAEFAQLLAKILQKQEPA